MKYFRHTQSEYGSYVDANGARYTVEWCSAVFSPSKQTPEDFGYEQFEDEETALNAWGLVPYVDPEAEAMLLEEPTAQAEQPND